MSGQDEVLTEIWCPHDEHTQYRWTRDIQDGKPGPWKVSGMLLFGEITAERLRSIRTTGDDAPRLTNWAVGNQSPNGPWREQATLEDFVSHRDDVEYGGARRLVEWHARGPDESADDFYLRVAQAFLTLHPQRPTDTTTALAELADVAFTKAVHWVREARNRGYLPKSNKQVNRGGRNV